MTNLKIILLLVCLPLLGSLYAEASINPTDNVFVKIEAIDPAGKSILASEDKLYLKVNYDSDIPLRFQASAVRNGMVLESGAIKNKALLHPSGKGEALAWVIYLNATHVDGVRLTVFNEEWEELYHLTRDADVTWQVDSPVGQRALAAWVKPLNRTEKRLTDFYYDPAPSKFGTLYDTFFYINLIAIPLYILLQLHMLYRYRYRWRELAFIPIFPYLIVGFYLLFNLGIERALIITFLFRYTFAAFLWLVALWVVKRFWEHRLAPPKLYKPQKV